MNHAKRHMPRQPPCQEGGCYSLTDPPLTQVDMLAGNTSDNREHACCLPHSTPFRLAQQSCRLLVQQPVRLHLQNTQLACRQWTEKQAGGQEASTGHRTAQVCRHHRRHAGWRNWWRAREEGPAAVAAATSRSSSSSRQGCTSVKASCAAHCNDSSCLFVQHGIAKLLRPCKLRWEVCRQGVWCVQVPS